MVSQRVLVPVKGDPADESAIRLACNMAQKNKGKVYAIYVIEVKRSLPLEAIIDPEVERGEAVLDRAEEYAADADYEVETELLKAREVGPAIVDAAVEKEADLIVMGVSYKRRFGEFSMGRNVPYVLKNAPCRVILSREPVPEAEVR
ncbi:MAG: universal stress protein [Dehalococcoidia bacterium]